MNGGFAQVDKPDVSRKQIIGEWIVSFSPSRLTIDPAELMNAFQ